LVLVHSSWSSDACATAKCHLALSIQFQLDIS